MQKIAIVIPCYNEDKRLNTQQFFEYTQENVNVSFIFVDDGSSDNTRKVIKSMGNQSKQILTIFLAKNYGKGEAVRQGILRAQSMKFDYIGFWDADLATPLSAINDFYKVMVEEQNISIVSGARVQLLGRDIQRTNMRHYLGRIFATVASYALNLAIYDTQCGAKLYKNDELLTKVVSVPFNVAWVFDVEILARYKILTESQNVLLDKLIIEYPLKKWTHKSGSKVKTTDFFKAILDIFKIYIYIAVPFFKTRYKRLFNLYV